MSLTLAKAMADNPAAYTITQLEDALIYLERTRNNGGVRNSERATIKLDRRLDRIKDEISRRSP